MKTPNSSRSSAPSADGPSATASASEPVDPIGAPPALSLDSPIFQDVTISLQARLGEVTLSVESLLALKAGSVITLDTQLNETIELRLNNGLVARGEIVAVDDNFGVRITEIAKVG